MSDETQNTEAQFDPFADLDFNSKAKELPPYLGIIIRDEHAASVYNGEVQHQWIYSVRPVDLHMGGKTGAWTAFVTFSDKGSSVFMKIRDEFKKIFGVKDEDGNTRRPGHGELEGLVAWWSNKSYDFGPNISASKPRPVPVRRASEEDIERARALPPYVPQASGDETSTEDTSAPELSPEQIEMGVKLYDGRAHKDVLKEVVKDQTMDSVLRMEVQSGRLLNQLIATGRLEKTEDGTLKALVNV